MKRTPLLVLMVLLGALAVGTLLFLSEGAPGDRARAGGRGSEEVSVTPGVGSRRAPASGTDGMAEGTPRSGAKGTAIVPPAKREPFDDQAMIEARARYAGRIEELLQEMIDPKLRFDEREARKRELVQLLRLMGHRVSPAVREQLLTMLATAPPNWRNQIADAIGSLEGDTDTAQALVRMLKSTPDDRETRNAIYSALMSMNVREVTPQLMAMIGEGVVDEALVIRTIGALATPEEVDQLFAWLDQPLRQPSRAEIEQVLQDRARVPGFLDKVAAALDGADPQKRRSLLKILSASTNPAHAAKVRDLLKNEADEESRGAAIRALGKYGDPESGKVLLEIAQRGSTNDQHRAIQAIFTIRDPDTIGILGRGFRELKGEGRLAVMGAMARLPAPTEEMLAIARTEGIVDSDLRVRTSSARVLGQRGRDDSVDPLVDFLRRSQHPSEVSAALSGLESIRTKKAAEAAIGALGAVPNPRQRDRWQELFQKIAEEAK
jgi:HEAT repeat protein